MSNSNRLGQLNAVFRSLATQQTSHFSAGVVYAQVPRGPRTRWGAEVHYLNQNVLALCNGRSRQHNVPVAATFQKLISSRRRARYVTFRHGPEARFRYVSRIRKNVVACYKCHRVKIVTA